jgi:hypothetical protein
MEACHDGGTDVMERPCAMARGKDINTRHVQCASSGPGSCYGPYYA